MLPCRRCLEGVMLHKHYGETSITTVLVLFEIGHWYTYDRTTGTGGWFCWMGWTWKGAITGDLFVRYQDESTIRPQPSGRPGRSCELRLGASGWRLAYPFGIMEPCFQAWFHVQLELKRLTVFALPRFKTRANVVVISVDTAGKVVF